MPRRCYEEHLSADDEDSPPKRKCSISNTNSIDSKKDKFITDITGKTWKLGKTIGTGGFGEIYEAYEEVSKNCVVDNYYVAKLEKHTSGPLFVEINCYLRIAKAEMIENWKKEKNLTAMGMPHYVASGSSYHNDEKFRFLLLPKYKSDLGQILHTKKLFNVKTVSNICIQILDVLEYIHNKGYIHSDIKASNIMLGNQTKPIRKSKSEDRIAKRQHAMVLRSPIITKRRSLRPKNVINYRDDLPSAKDYLNTSEGIENKKDIRDNSDDNKNRNQERKLRPIHFVNYSDDIPCIDDYLYTFEYIENKKDSEDKDENLNQIYLVDFGLAAKYLTSTGEHKDFCEDARKAHAGTVLFCSRDAHKGIASRRSDLESLAYNMVYWLTGTLPWIEDIEQPTEVEKKKTRCFRNIKRFLELSFNNNYPQFVLDYFKYLEKLEFQEDPDYNYFRGLFKTALKLYGYKKDPVFDFDNVEGSGKLQKKEIYVANSNAKIINQSFLIHSPLMPLHSNIVFKRPKLRKKAKSPQLNSIMNWSKILTDPEEIIKQGRERKNTEGSEPDCTLSSLDIASMNPTYAMLEVYNKCIGKQSSPKYKRDSNHIENIEGYTAAMMNVYVKMQEKNEFELNTYDNRRVRRVQRQISRSRGPSVKRSHSSHQLSNKKSNAAAFKRSYRLRG